MTPPVNDGDAAKIFDRAAEKICAKCSQCARCWQQDYQTTKGALCDALPKMLDRGGGEPEDFPSYFADRCAHFRSFLDSANQELERLMARRRYDSRVRESRAAVCAQYGQLAGVLERAAAEVSAELTVDVRRQRQIKQRLAALGLEGRCAVFHDEHGTCAWSWRGRMWTSWASRSSWTPWNSSWTAPFRWRTALRAPCIWPSGSR